MDNELKLELAQEKIKNIELNYALDLLVEDILLVDSEGNKKEIKQKYMNIAHTHILSLFEGIQIEKDL